MAEPPLLEPRTLTHQARACALQAGGGQRQPRAGWRMLTLGLHSQPARRGRERQGVRQRGLRP